MMNHRSSADGISQVKYGVRATATNPDAHTLARDRSGKSGTVAFWLRLAQYMEYPTLQGACLKSFLTKLRRTWSAPSSRKEGGSGTVEWQIWTSLSCTYCTQHPLFYCNVIANVSVCIARSLLKCEWKTRC